jgi:thioredoxin reductase
VAGVRGPGTSLTAVDFADGSERPCGGLLVAVTLHQRSELAQQLGAATVESPLAADAIEIDSTFQTSVPGLFAAGDATPNMQSVANAVAAGQVAAAMIVHAQMAEVDSALAYSRGA